VFDAVCGVVFDAVDAAGVLSPPDQTYGPLQPGIEVSLAGGVRLFGRDKRRVLPNVDDQPK